MRLSSPPVIFACVLTLSGCSSVLPARRPPLAQSRVLVQMGAADLTAQRAEEGLQKFSASGLADPSFADAFFFQGAALNRLGRAGEALARLQRAAGMGCDHPDLAFETAWSLLMLERWSDALASLERSERAHPGHGKTSEFIGRAFFGLGEDDKARAMFAEALKREPTLGPTVLLYLALLEERRGNIDAAREHLGSVVRQFPDSPLGPVLREDPEQLSGPDASTR